MKRTIRPQTKGARKAHKARQRRLNDWMPRLDAFSKAMRDGVRY